MFFLLDQDLQLLVRDSEDSGTRDSGLGDSGTRGLGDSLTFTHRLFQAYFFSQKFCSTNVLFFKKVQGDTKVV